MGKAATASAPATGGILGLAKDLVGQTAYGQLIADPVLKNLTGTGLYDQGQGTNLADLFKKPFNKLNSKEQDFVKSNYDTYMKYQTRNGNVPLGDIDPSSEQFKELTRWMASSKDVDDVASKIDFAVKNKDVPTIALIVNKLAGISSVAIQQGVVSDEEARRVLGGVMSNFGELRAGNQDSASVQRFLESPAWASAKNMAAAVNDGLKARMKTYKDIFNIPVEFFDKADITLPKISSEKRQAALDKVNTAIGQDVVTDPKVKAEIKARLENLIGLPEGGLKSNFAITQDVLDKGNAAAAAQAGYLNGLATGSATVEKAKGVYDAARKALSDAMRVGGTQAAEASTKPEAPAPKAKPKAAPVVNVPSQDDLAKYERAKIQAAKGGKKAAEWASEFEAKYGKR